MNINSHKLTLAAVIYPYIGVVLFLAAWLRWYWAIPAVVLIILGFRSYIRDLADRETGQVLKVHVILLVFIVFVLLLYCLASGCGGFFTQPGDWRKHNAVLNDLIQYQWPVCYHNKQESAMLSYYIAHYLVPAVVGKLTDSYHIAEFAMLLWNVIGLFFVVLLLFRLIGADIWKKQVITFAIFLFFGSALFLAQALYGAVAVDGADVAGGAHWISNSIRLQYPSNWIHIHWAFPQAITPWIITALFLENYRDTKNYVFLAAPLLMNATFGFLGIGLLMIGVFVCEIMRSGDLKGQIRIALSRNNLFALAGAVLIPFIYLCGNVLAEGKPEEVGLSIIDYGSKTALYFCFCISFLCYSFVIYDECRNHLLFYLVNGLLCLLPLFQGGLWNDLCMRTSVPAMFLLMIFVIRSLFAFWADGRQLRVFILAVLLLIGAYYPVCDMVHLSFAADGSNAQVAGSLVNFAYRDGSVAVDEAYNYFTYDYEESKFYRFFAKK